MLFGIGMMLGGGCASGTLMRVGEGFTMHLLVLVFFIFGSLFGANNFGWWSKQFVPAKGVFLPDILGWPIALLFQFGALLAIFIFADWFSNRKSKQ